MYERFYGFREPPFDLTPNPRFLVLTEAHQEALSNLEYGIASNKGITMLVGEAGSGKTTVIRTAIDRQPARVHAVHLHNPTLQLSEFVELLASRFGLSERATQSKAVMLIELEALLRGRRERGETTVLVVDEAQRLSNDLLEEIRLLSNIETDDQKLMCVVIAGQPELSDRLEETSLRQLKQRVALRCELPTLSLREGVSYMAGRIRTAGGSGGQVFTKEAVCLIHERSGGLPRLINVLADNCLVGGFAAGKKPVDTALVNEVCRDFRLGPKTPSGDVAPAGNAGPETARPDEPETSRGTDEPEQGQERKRFLFF